MQTLKPKSMYFREDNFDPKHKTMWERLHAWYKNHTNESNVNRICNINIWNKEYFWEQRIMYEYIFSPHRIKIPSNGGVSLEKAPRC